MQIETVKSELRTALAGDLGEAISLMLQKFRNDSDHMAELFVQSGRYHQASSDFNKGIILIGERDTVFNKVRLSLLELIDQLQEEDIKAAGPDAAQAAAFGLAPAASDNPIDLLLSKLRVDWKNIAISELHLVNCDRKQEFNTWKRALRERSAGGEEFQFYFINACPMQRPQSFSERAILEIIRNLDEEENDAVLVRRLPESNRIKMEDLPYDWMGLEESKKKFAKYFEERFDFHEPIEPVEDFLKACVHEARQYRYIAFVFQLDAQNWESFFPEYLQWILDTFATAEEEGPVFLFFFPVYIRNLHLALSAEAKEIVQAIQTLGAAKNAISTVISPLQPVPKSDVGDWFLDFGEADAGKIDELLLLSLQLEKSAQARLKHFQESGLLDMYDVETLQEAVYRFSLK